MSNTPEPTKPDNPNALWKRRMGVLWMHESKSGTKYLSGVLKLKLCTGKDEEVNVIVMKNNTKTMEKHADYEVFLNPPKTADFISETKPVVEEPPVF